MNILIFGASGFIGHACYKYFSVTHQVMGVDMLPHLQAPVLLHQNVSESELLIQQHAFDVIINCAGSSNIQQSFVNPELDYERNTLFVEKILTCLKNHSPHTKFINLSSAAVYGNPDRIPVKESDPVHPLSPYGKHKRMAEEVIAKFATEHDVKGLSCRIFSAYGPGLKRQFFYDLSQKFMQGHQNIVLQGTGRESRDFIFIDDIIEGFNTLIQQAPFNGDVFNLADGNEVFIDEAALLYADLFGFKGKISYSQKQFDGYPLNWQADIGKIQALGFRPKISLERGLRFYSDWIKRNFNA